MALLDETDIEILHSLQKDAKINAKELSEKLHISKTPIYERIKRLENEGYILFDTNSNIEYILELDKNFKVLIHKNNKICGIINYNFQEILNEIKINKF